MKRIVLAAMACALAATSAPMAFAQPQGQWKQHNEWHKGAQIQKEDWNRGQPVDYHAHHLRRPPAGHEWRQVDGNYVLAAVATGVIASVIAHPHH